MQLIIRNLSKSYPNGVQALDDVSLTIPQGMFGLLGPNGAGKSTLMRIIATLLDADRGEARLGDLNVLSRKEDVRRLLGYLPQDFGVYPKVSAREMLDHIALLKGLTESRQRKQVVDALLEKVNLSDQRRKALAGFSGGMRQRFGIAQALIGDPKLIIVDEPTAGLDPGERNRFYNLLSEIGENVIVILSTHIVEDVKELCPNMAILHEGRLRYSGPTTAGVASLQGRIWQRSISKAEVPDYTQRFRVISTKLIAGRPLIHIYSDTEPGDGFSSVEPDLEDLFFSTIHGVHAC